MKKLDEGMRMGDLEDIVLPLVSVDEFKSKVDDNAIVFGFHVGDQDAAKDLNRFLQKSPAPLLDTDVSPAPDQQGYYLVFFELLANDNLGENVSLVLDEVSPLTKISSWQMRIRDVDRLVPFSEPALLSHMKRLNAKKGGIDEQVLTFLQPSGLSMLDSSNGHLIIEALGDHAEFEVIEIGDVENILENDLGGMQISMQDAAKEMRLIRMLGEGWSVSRLSDLNVLTYEGSEIALVLRDR